MNEPGPENEIKDQNPEPGNRFENLLFVTASAGLRKNIGEVETEKVLSYIKNLPNCRLVDLPVTDNAGEAAREVRKSFTADTKGVVLIGGYDVVPSLQMNILSDPLLREIENDPESQGEEWDIDDFIVWSDDIYGDKEGDLLPELPVSRIPDGKSPELVMTALQAPLPGLNDKYGVRNIKRPFAIDVFEKIPFSQKQLLEVSEDCSPKTISGKSLKGPVYFMLHGHDNDATRFTGELGTKSGYYEAFDIYNIPANCRESVVFSGCCYGALVALPKADRKEPGMTIRSRTHEQSIALAFLRAGVNAFVGCTGLIIHQEFNKRIFLGSPCTCRSGTGFKISYPRLKPYLRPKWSMLPRSRMGCLKLFIKQLR